MNTASPESPLSAGAEPAWVWIGDGKDDRNAYVLFRRELDAALGQDVVLRISAESRYRAYLNGQFIGEGPPSSLPHLMYYESHDLGPRLAPGRNCLAVIVHQVRRRGRGGLWAAITGLAGSQVDVIGPSWRCRRAPQWNPKMQILPLNAFDPNQESYDARKEPAGWMRAGFDDSSWAQAVAFADAPWSQPVPRDIPAQVERAALPAAIERVEECIWLENRPRPEDLSIALSQVGRPVTHALVQNAASLVGGEGPATVQCSTEHLKDPTFDGVYDPCIVLDFGRVIAAYVELDIEGVEGASVDIGIAERLVDGCFNNALEGSFAARYTMKAGRQTWRTAAWRGMRYVKLRVRECFQPLRIHAVRAIVTSYPFQDKGRFHSSDARLNGVFDICRYTIRLCSHESIMDTPWREQGQWMGDISAVISGGIYACFGDDRLVGKFLRQSSVARRPDGFLQKVTNMKESPGLRMIPDYTLWWMMAVWNHYLYTGQRRWIEQIFPVIHDVIQLYRPYVDDHGLMCDMPYWVFIDWANVDVRGECTAFNAIFIGAMETVATMADELGQADKAADLRSLAAGARANFVRRLYDPRRGVFADANVGGQLSQKVSEHANVAAIHFGLCDEALAAGIIRRLYEDKSVPATEATPFFTAVVLRALDAAGRMDLAVGVLRDRWGKRMVDRGATSCYEEWGQNGSWRSGTYAGFMRTHSHAWSAAPAEFLIRNLAGIRILSPGCRKVRVDPRQVDFDYELTYPTPLGAIDVACKGGKITVQADSRIEIVR